MSGTVWLMFVLMEGALTLTPGPAVLFVSSSGLRYGAANAIASAMGILTANAVFFAISGTGVGALLATSDTVFIVVKSAGALYLLYLGAAALLRPTGGAEAENGSDAGRCALFFRGFVLQLSNPKALLFFAAILPQFLDPARPVVLQLLILGGTSIVLEFCVLSAYGVAAARVSRVAMRPRFAAATGRLSGVLLLGAAFGLMRLER